jgi:hypothetical protein
VLVNVYALNSISSVVGWNFFVLDLVPEVSLIFVLVDVSGSWVHWWSLIFFISSMLVFADEKL